MCKATVPIYSPRIRMCSSPTTVCAIFPPHSHLSRTCLLHSWAGRGRGMNQPCQCKCLHFHTALTGSHRRLQESGGEGIKKKREKKKKAERVAGGPEISLEFKLKGWAPCRGDVVDKGRESRGRPLPFKRSHKVTSSFLCECHQICPCHRGR